MAKFNRVTPFLATRSIAETVAFYTQFLGFEVNVLYPPDKPTLAILDRDFDAATGRGVSLIFDASLWPDPPALTGQLSFDLQPGGVLELHARLSGQVEILWGPEVYHYGRREFSCRDPNGYALVFSERTDDPPTCPAE